MFPALTDNKLRQAKAKKMKNTEKTNFMQHLKSIHHNANMHFPKS
jgi:hypothetical protein